MDLTTETLAALLIAFLVGSSFVGFQHQSFTFRTELSIRRIRWHHEYYRLLLAGFVHRGWRHLLLHVGALFAFGVGATPQLAPFAFIGFYLAGLIGGNALAVAIRRHEFNYFSSGASGGISAIVFAYLISYPQGRISLAPAPLEVDAWLVALGFALLLLVGILKRLRPEGCEAYLGGAVTGGMLTLLFNTQLLATRAPLVLALMLPCALVLMVMFLRPELLTVLRQLRDDKGQQQGIAKEREAFNQQYTSPREQEAIVNYLLDKVHSQGLESLTHEEIAQLDRAAQMLA